MAKEPERFPLGRYIIGIAVVFIVIWLLMTCIVTVPAGSIGVDDTFGVVSDTTRSPGISLKNPFTSVHVFSVKTQELLESSSVPSKEGLIVALDVSILYHMQSNMANQIYKTIGDDYVNIFIVPQLRSFIREITSRYEAKALYTTGRDNITVEIFNAFEPKLLERGVILEKVLLRDLTLPSTVTNAIEQKLKAEQEALQMQFTLQKETLEAERKTIEASGIASAQTIINQNLTNAYLEWYWIGALKDNKNVIYVPIGTNGLPLFKQVP
jgi:regulator of protease activity HflC (stomatin/prohibitin superfamily)